MRRTFDEFRGFTADGAKSGGERVERLQRFGFRGLDHQGFFNDEREIDRRCVEAVVEQAFGDVHRGHAGLLLDSAGTGDEFVHAAVAVRNFQEILDLAEQIIGVQHGVLGSLSQALATERADVEVAAQKNADVAEKCTRPDRWISQASTANTSFSPRRNVTTGAGRNGARKSRTAIGPAPGPPAP